MYAVNNKAKYDQHPDQKHTGPREYSCRRGAEHELVLQRQSSQVAALERAGSDEDPRGASKRSPGRGEILRERCWKGWSKS